MKRNEGFSLVELIVVIAIMAILGGMTITGTGMLTNWNVNKCVDLLDASLSQTRINAMSKRASYLTISTDGDGNYYAEVTGSSREPIASRGVTITYTEQVEGMAASADPIEITAAQPLILTYDRASGAFAPIVQVDASTGKYVYRQDGDGEDVGFVYCTGLQVRAGDEKVVNITFAKSTGKHTVE